MYEHAMRLGQEVSGLDSLQKQVEFDRDNKICALLKKKVLMIQYFCGSKK